MLQAANAQDGLGTYIKAVLCSQTQNKIAEFVSLLNIENCVAKHDLHVTVVASRVDIPASDSLLSSPIIAHPAGFSIFDNGVDRCLVILLHSIDLHDLHIDYRRRGASHDYPQYQPHVTLSYDYLSDQPPADELIDCLPEFRFDLLHVEPFIYE